MIILIVGKDLCLILETSESPGVNDPIPVALKAGTILVFVLRVYPSTRLAAMHSIFGENTLLVPFFIFSGK
jgi:hypothetical protein